MKMSAGGSSSSSTRASGSSSELTRFNISRRVAPNKKRTSITILNTKIIDTRFLARSLILFSCLISLNISDCHDLVPAIVSDSIVSTSDDRYNCRSVVEVYHGFAHALEESDKKKDRESAKDRDTLLPCRKTDPETGEDYEEFAWCFNSRGPKEKDDRCVTKDWVLHSIVTGFVLLLGGNIFLGIRLSSAGLPLVALGNSSTSSTTHQKEDEEDYEKPENVNDIEKGINNSASSSTYGSTSAPNKISRNAAPKNAAPKNA